MKKQYDLVVFDWEGTIVEDALGHIVTVITHEAKRFHLGAVDKLLARRYITQGLTSAIRQLFPHLTLHQYEQFIEAVQDSISHSFAEMSVVEDAESTIRLMHVGGIKLAIATNKGYQSLLRALHQSGLSAYFKVIRSASQVPAKPCPQMLAEIIQESGVMASRTLMIGDSVSDIEMAMALDVDAIGMDFYHVWQDEFFAAGAIQVFDSYQHLVEYLNLSGVDT